MSNDVNFARPLWQRLETLHAVTYFGDETAAAGKALGLAGFWMSYFGFRSAPMGAVSSGVVEATFFNFAPTFVRRWVPEVWTHSAPAPLLEARAEAGAATLRRVVPGIETLACDVNPMLRRAVDHATAAGRALFAANRDLLLPDDHVAALWQLCTSLREHRGDGHVAALTAQGIDGLEAHVLISADGGTTAEDLQRTRGWTEQEWAHAAQRCHERGWLGDDGGLTEAGRLLRHQVEETTDHLAAQPFDGLTHTERDDVLAALTPAAIAVSQAGIIRYPNPIGLAPVA